MPPQIPDLPTAPGASAPDGTSTGVAPSWRRALFFSLVILGTFLVGCELLARVVLYLQGGRNPYFLTFGFVPDLEWNSWKFDGYAKFQPNVTMHQRTGAGTTVSMLINSDGFRGPRNFARPKPPGVFRVVTLGASSTFGYENPDEDTYPVQLEELLRAKHGERCVEVLNLGIPQFRLANVLALARRELAGLEPDVVTFYEGYNNALMPKAREDAGRLYRWKDWLYFHSVGWRVIHSAVRATYHWFTAALNRDLIGAHGLAWGLSFSPQHVDSLRAAVRTEFDRQLDSLAQMVQGVGAQLILVSQPITLYYYEDRSRQLGWRPYAVELNESRRHLAQNDELSSWETVMVVHGDLVGVEQELAARKGLRFVDGIGALDPDRGGNFVSGVHLTRVGNRRLALVIADAVAELPKLGAGTGGAVLSTASSPCAQAPAGPGDVPARQSAP